MAAVVRSTQTRDGWANRPRRLEDGRPPQGQYGARHQTSLQRKVGKDGQVEKYKCRFVAQGFRQIKGLHYQESSSPTPTQSSIRMALALMALADWEGRQLDVEMAYLEADVEEELHIELPDGYRESRNQVGLLQKAMYGLVHAGLLWSKTFGGASSQGI